MLASEITIDPRTAQRIQGDHTELTKLGFSPTPPLYTMGSKLGEWTESGFRRVEAEFAAKPNAIPALRSFASDVAKEERIDLDYRVRDLSLAIASDGRTSLVNHDRFPEDRRELLFERDGLKQLASWLETPGASTFIPSVNPMLRMLSFNGLKNVIRKHVKLRTRLNGTGDRTVYAVRSRRYAAYDPSDLAADVANLLEEDGDHGSKAEIMYDGLNTEVKVLWHNWHSVEDSGAGDAFRFGFRVRTADDGSRRVTVDLLAHLNRCLNYLIVALDSARVADIRHVGDSEQFVTKVKGAIGAAHAKVQPFLSRWQEAGKTNLLEQANKSQPREVFELLLARGLVKVPGVTPEVFVDRAMKAWQKHPGYSTLAFVNALTEAAHTNTWASPWTQEAIQTQASQLVYVHRVFA